MSVTFETRLTWEHPKRYFDEHRALERAGRYDDAAAGFEHFSNRWGYQVFTLPLALRSASRLLAIGTKTDDPRLLRLGIQRGRELMQHVPDPEPLVEHWNRLAILALERGQLELAEYLLARCNRTAVRDPRFAVSAELTSATLRALRGDTEGAIVAFTQAATHAEELAMYQALEVARRHFEYALQG